MLLFLSQVVVIKTTVYIAQLENNLCCYVHFSCAVSALEILLRPACILKCMRFSKLPLKSFLRLFPTFLATNLNGIYELCSYTITYQTLSKIIMPYSDNACLLVIIFLLQLIFSSNLGRATTPPCPTSKYGPVETELHSPLPVGNKMLSVELEVSA